MVSNVLATTPYYVFVIFTNTAWLAANYQYYLILFMTTVVSKVLATTTIVTMYLLFLLMPHY